LNSAPLPICSKNISRTFLLIPIPCGTLTPEKCLSFINLAIFASSVVFVPYLKTSPAVMRSKVSISCSITLPAFLSFIIFASSSPHICSIPISVKIIHTFAISANLTDFSFSSAVKDSFLFKDKMIDLKDAIKLINFSFTSFFTASIYFLFFLYLHA
jgi:hypothetical protein